MKQGHGAGRRAARARGVGRAGARGVGRAGARAGLCLLAAWIVVLSGCGRGAGGWREKDLATTTVDWRSVKGQHLSDVLATPSIAPRGVDLLLCRWPADAPIRIGWPEDADDRELAAFERARAAWSGVVPGLSLVRAARDEAQITLDFVQAGDPNAPTGTADTVADCRVSAGRSALVDATERGRIVHASILLRRENVSWSGRTSPMSEDEFLGAVLHEIGHALGVAGHVSDPIIGRRSVMSADRDRVKRVARRIAKGEALREPTLQALYLVPFDASVGRVGFDPELRPALDGLAELAEIEGWTGPFGRAGGDVAQVFWRTPDGDLPAVYTYLWSDAIRGKRQLDWMLSLEARASLERLARPPAATPSVAPASP